MTENINIHQVILDPSIQNYPYLCEDIVQQGTSDDGNVVLYISCIRIDLSHPHYLEAMVLASPSNEQRKVLLRHSFVVAILEVVNLQNQPGFDRQQEFHEQ